MTPLLSFSLLKGIGKKKPNLLGVCHSAAPGLAASLGQSWAPRRHSQGLVALHQGVVFFFFTTLIYLVG